VLLSVATIAKRHAVRDFIAEVGVRGKGLDMVRVQDNRVTIPTMLAAVLAGVVITFVYSLAPITVFNPVAGDVVLMRLVDVVSEAGALAALCLFAVVGVSQFVTALRAVLSQPSPLAVLGHRLLALWARHLDRKAVRADLIFLVDILTPFFANLTALPYAAGICSQSSGAGHAGGAHRRLALFGQSGRGYSTLGAGLEAGTVARIANSVFARIAAADLTAILHTHTLSHIGNCGKLAERLCAGMGLDAHKVE
jgi:hypothetical protein